MIQGASQAGKRSGRNGRRQKEMPEEKRKGRRRALPLLRRVVAGKVVVMRMGRDE